MESRKDHWQWKILPDQILLKFDWQGLVIKKGLQSDVTWVLTDTFDASFVPSLGIFKCILHYSSKVAFSIPAMLLDF